MNPTLFNNILHQAEARLFLRHEQGMFFLSKYLISNFFFHTPASAKAEPSPAWSKDREFIYFLQQLLLGKVTGVESLQRAEWQLQ